MDDEKKKMNSDKDVVINELKAEIEKIKKSYEDKIKICLKDKRN